MIHIIDDFYSDPDKIREQGLALEKKIGKKGNNHKHPGSRSMGSFSDENKIYLRNRFSKILGKNVITFKNAANFNYSEQEDEYNWVHFDWTINNYGTDYNMWASVIYLTPNAPLNTGTALFRHIPSGTLKIKGAWDRGDPWQGSWFDTKDRKYEPHTIIGNVYNRCILYTGDYFHTSLNGGFSEGRLTQVSFFQAEK